MRSVELFKFVRGTDVWTKTSGGEQIIYNTETYAPTAMKHTDFDEKNEVSKAMMTIELPLTDDLVQNYLVAVPNQILTLSIYRYNALATLTFWKGRLVSYDVRGTTASFKFESIFTSLRRPGLRARYTYQCRHVVYGPGCNLDPEDFAVVASATAIVGSNTITVPIAATFPDHRFRGGMIAQPDGTKLFVSSHVGDQITVNWPASNIKAVIAADGDADVKLYPGCDLQDTTCDTVFNNIPNNGGFKWIPTKTLFSGNSVV